MTTPMPEERNEVEARGLRLETLLSRLPGEWPVCLLPEIRRLVESSGRKVVVIDDDPTGTQTVEDVAVLTDWDVDALASELRGDRPVFYVLTNSRSLPLAEAQAVNREIGRNLRAAAPLSGRDFVVVSRSDSTLRGHFPGEVESLVQALEQEIDGWLVVPFFLEGGRYTIGDVHYVAEAERLLPAGQTAFARDPVFGYRASNLREWIEEKTWGRTPAASVASLSLEEIRREGPRGVRDRLLRLKNARPCVVNAASYRDLEVFVLGLLKAEAQGGRYLYRTAASFVRVRAGLAPRRLLDREDLDLSPQAGGLIVVGSHVPGATQQISVFLDRTNVQALEVSVDALLSLGLRSAEVERAAQWADVVLRRGEDALIFTERKRAGGEDAGASLSISRAVSDGLVDIVRGIRTRPRFLLAKGGITSSDIATKALGVRRAWVLGQILPGVPVWQCGPESRHPGMPYIVFPGNVGGPDGLSRVVGELVPGAPHARSKE